MQSLLSCHVSPGMFSSEYAVSGATFDDKGFSTFVPKQYVDVQPEPREGESVPGWVQVAVCDQQGDLVLVRLPREVLGGSRYITVKQSELQLSQSIAAV